MPESNNPFLQNPAGSTSLFNYDKGKSFADNLKVKNLQADQNLAKKAASLPKSDIKYADADIDKFTAQDGFISKGFNPDDPENYKRFADKETFGSALSKGIDSFKHNFVNTHNEGWYMYKRYTDALLNADLSKVSPDQSELLSQYYEDQKNADKNFVFQDPKFDNDIFTKRTMAEFLGNAGFAFGTAAQFAEELAVDALITAISAPAGGEGAATFGVSFGKFGASLAKLSEKMSKTTFGRMIEGVGIGTTMSEAAILQRYGRQLDQAQNLATAARRPSILRSTASEYFRVVSANIPAIIKSKSIKDLALNTAEALPLVGTAIRQGKKIAQGAEVGLSTAHLAGMTAAGIRRMTQELSMSLTEANMEAASSYGDTLDLMLEKYKIDNNNEPPTLDEFTKMKDIAGKAAYSNLHTNLGILSVTNKLQFGTLFGKFLPANRLMGDILEDEGKKILTTYAGKSYIKKGLFGTYGLMGQISKDFGKKAAVKEFGRQFTKDFLRFEVTEGIQENMQEASASAWKSYYAGQYNATKMTLAQAFNKGISEQFTKQGFKTFLQGAFTGHLLKGPTKVAEYVVGKVSEMKYGKENNPIIQARETLQKSLDLVNDLQQQMASKKFDAKHFNFTAQVASAINQTDAAAKNSRYEWHNAQDDAILAAAVAANQTGTIDAFIQSIKNLSDISHEEFEQLTGTKIEDTKYSSPREFVQELSDDVSRYSKQVDAIRTKFKNFADPTLYKKGSEDYIFAGMVRNAQEEAVKIAALSSLKSHRADTRAKEVAQKLSSIPGLSESSAYALRVLTNHDNLLGELGILKTNLKFAQSAANDENLDAKTKSNAKKDAAEISKKIEQLETWQSYWKPRSEITGNEQDGNDLTFVGISTGKKDIVDEDGNILSKGVSIFDTKHKDVAQTFTDVINQNSTKPISKDDVQNGLEHIADFIQLDRDAKDYLKAVEVLNDPQGYHEILQNMTNGYFKYNLLEFLDGAIQKVDDVIVVVFQEAIKTGKFDTIQNLDVIRKELLDKIFDTSAYKKIQAVINDPNTTIEAHKYVAELVQEYQDFLKKEITLLLSKHAETVYQDIDNEDFTEFEENPDNIDDMYLESIAKLLSDNKKLTPNQQKVYEVHKDKIDSYKEFYDANKDEFDNAYDSENEDIPDDYAKVLADEASLDEIDTVLKKLLDKSSKNIPLTETEVFIAQEHVDRLNELREAPSNNVESVQETNVEEQDVFDEDEDFTTALDVSMFDIDGLNVVDETGKVVESFPTETKAQEVATSLNEQLSNVEFVTALLKDKTDPNSISSLTSDIISSIEGYLTKQGLNTSIEDYYNTADGKKFINDLITNSVEVDEEYDDAGAMDVSQFMDLVSDTPTQTAATISAEIKDMFTRLQKVMQANEKNGIFVERPTLESIEDELRSITNCL